MIDQIENTGTGSIEHSGTGSIEQSGTGSIEHSGTGSIEHSGTGSIEHSGTGRIARRLALSAALACVFSGAALAETASYDTSYGTIDVHSDGSEVRISWHYDDGASRQFLVGAGSVSTDYSLIKLRPVGAALKVESDGTSNGSSYGGPGAAEREAGNRQFRESGVSAANFLKVESDGTSNGSSYGGPGAAEREAGSRQFGESGVSAANFLKVESDGTSNGASIGGGWGGEIELLFTANGIEAVATMRNAYAEKESIVLDLNNRSEFSRAVVFLGTETL